MPLVSVALLSPKDKLHWEQRAGLHGPLPTLHHSLLSSLVPYSALLASVFLGWGRSHVSQDCIAELGSYVGPPGGAGTGKGWLGQGAGAEPGHSHGSDVHLHPASALSCSHQQSLAFLQHQQAAAGLP